MKITEQLASLFPGVEITEEFVDKLQAMIDVTVSKSLEEKSESLRNELVEAKNTIAKLTEERDSIVEQTESEIVARLTQKANEYGQHIQEEMAEEIDGYCEYVVENFINENKRRLVETDEYNRMATVFRQIREVFEKNYFQLNGEPANQSLVNEIQSKKAEYNELFGKHLQLKRQVKEYSEYVTECNKEAMFEQKTAHLAETQKDRIRRLVENADFQTMGSYEAGLDMMIEDINPGKKDIPMIKESRTADDFSGTPSVQPLDQERMKAYLSRL